jgi:hypothetical protein
VAEFLHIEAALVNKIIKEEEESEEKLRMEEEAEIERIAKENVKKRQQHWRELGLCQFCGGAFHGLFDSRCSKCGIKKNY